MPDLNEQNFDMGPPLRVATTDELQRELVSRFPLGGVALFVGVHPDNCPCCPRSQKGITYSPVFWGSSFMQRGMVEVLREHIMASRVMLSVEQQPDGPPLEGAAE